MLLAKILKHKVGLLALLSFVAIAFITFFKSALELEDAEQAYYSQWLRWGYDDQPPLYTWLQYIINQVFGVQKVSFSLLRGLIFAGILLLMGQFTSNMLKNRRKVELAVFGLVLLPVFIDLTFRRLSHTSLLCLAILATFLVVQRLLHHKTWTNYALFGLILSVGMMSKYNYILFLAAFCFALIFDSLLRQVLFNKKMILSILLIVLFLFPHFFWLLGPEGYLPELQESIAQKTENSAENGLYVIGPLSSLVLTLIKLILPLLVVFAVAFFQKNVTFRKPKMDWFLKLALAQLVVLVLFFVILNVQKVEERWLMPLLLPFMILLLRSVEFKAIQKWSFYGFAIFVSLIAVQVIRTPVEKLLGIPSSVHFGFEPLATSLQKNYPDKQWILPDVTFGGSIRLLNLEKEIFTRDDFSLPKSKLKDVDGVVVIIGKENLKEKIALEQLLDFGKEKDTLFILNFERDIPSFE